MSEIIVLPKALNICIEHIGRSNKMRREPTEETLLCCCIGCKEIVIGLVLPCRHAMLNHGIKHYITHESQPTNQITEVSLSRRYSFSNTPRLNGMTTFGLNSNDSWPTSEKIRADTNTPTCQDRLTAAANPASHLPHFPLCALVRLLVCETNIGMQM